MVKKMEKLSWLKLNKYYLKNAIIPLMKIVLNESLRFYFTYCYAGVNKKCILFDKLNCKPTSLILEDVP